MIKRGCTDPIKSHIEIRFSGEMWLVTLGAPFAFKGEIGKHLAHVYSVGDNDANPTKDGFHRITIGEEVAFEIKNNPAFSERNREILTSGGLLPDEEISPLAERSYNFGKENGFHRFYLDGHGRRASQIEELVAKGILGEKSICLILDVDLKTCKERLKYALEHGTRSHRLDNDKLEDRYRLYKEHEDSVRQALLKHRIDHEPINANQELEQVKADVLKCVSRVCRLPKPTPIATRTPQPLVNKAVMAFA